MSLWWFLLGMAAGAALGWLWLRLREVPAAGAGEEKGPALEAVERPTAPRVKPPPEWVVIRYTDEAGDVVGDEQIEVRMRRPSRDWKGGRYQATCVRADGSWEYRRVRG